MDSVVVEKLVQMRKNETECFELKVGVTELKN